MKRMVCIDNDPRPFIIKNGKHYLIEEKISDNSIYYLLYDLDGNILYSLKEDEFNSMFITIDEWRQSQLNKILI